MSTSTEQKTAQQNDARAAVRAAQAVVDQLDNARDGASDARFRALEAELKRAQTAQDAVDAVLQTLWAQLEDAHEARRKVERECAGLRQDVQDARDDVEAIESRLQKEFTKQLDAAVKEVEKKDENRLADFANAEALRRTNASKAAEADARERRMVARRRSLVHAGIWFVPTLVFVTVVVARIEALNIENALIVTAATYLVIMVDQHLLNASSAWWPLSLPTQTTLQGLANAAIAVLSVLWLAQFSSNNNPPCETTTTAYPSATPNPE